MTLIGEEPLGDSLSHLLSTMIFFGIAIRVGKEFADDVSCGVFHLTLQVGYGQFTIGIAEKEL